MYPSPLSPIPAAAFAFPDLIAVFSTPVFTPLVVVTLLLECFFLIFGCMLLWELARPLTARRPPAHVSTALKFNSPPLREGMLLQKQRGRIAVPRAAAPTLPENAEATKIQ